MALDYKPNNNVYQKSPYQSFLETVDRTIQNPIFHKFEAGNLCICFYMGDKSIYLWQDKKGNICYSFDWTEQEYYTTTKTNLSNVLSSHFQSNIEAVNNYGDALKKRITVTEDLSKSLSNKERYDSFPNYTVRESSSQEIITMDTNGDTYETNPNLPAVNQQYPQFNQEQLHLEIVNLSTLQLNYNHQKFNIELNKIPIVHNELFKPHTQMAFWSEKGLNFKNSYTPSEYMTKTFISNTFHESFILSFIFSMAKNDVKEAMKILCWFAVMFITKQKLPFALVLHSKSYDYMKLFWEEIIEPLMNICYCETITNNDLDVKSLSNTLDKKVCYHFHNVTNTSILEMPAKDFTNRLIHKDDYKIKNKISTTVANILITSTSNYIPLINKDVPKVFIEIESDLDVICKNYNISVNKYHTLANYIKYDLDNFAQILRRMDLNHFYNLCGFTSFYGTNDNSKIFNGDDDILEVFNGAIRYSDEVLLTFKNQDLQDELFEDFGKNRINSQKLIKYFEAIFGEGIYKSNRAIIKALKEISTTELPFDSTKQFNIHGVVYYELS
jgi:hypothetical protein